MMVLVKSIKTNNISKINICLKTNPSNTFSFFHIKIPLIIQFIFLLSNARFDKSDFISHTLFTPYRPLLYNYFIIVIQSYVT